MINDSVRRVLSMNPMHYIVHGYRDNLLFHKWFWENPYETASFWAITIAFWVIVRLVFKKLSPFFADEV